MKRRFELVSTKDTVVISFRVGLGPSERFRALDYIDLETKNGWLTVSPDGNPEFAAPENTVRSIRVERSV